MFERNRFWLKMAFCALLAGAGCDADDEATADAGGGGHPHDAGEDHSDATTADAGTSDPIYLITVATPGTGEDDLGSLYGLLRHEIDLEVSRDDLAAEKAKEFEAYTGMSVIGGEVVIGESTRPFAKKFVISDDFVWTQVGDPKELDFTDYVVDAVDGLNFYYQAINGTDMLLFYGSDRAWRKHWNTEDWAKKEEYTDSGELPLGGDGWTLGSTGNRTGIRDWQGAILQTFVLRDENWNASKDSWIAVYDEDSYLQTATIEVPCPGLEQQTMAEDGSIYVSTTFNSPLYQLYGLQEPSCIVRMNKDGTKDESWDNKKLSDLTTGGFDGVNFRYLREGIAAANVLHHDRIDGADFSAGEIEEDVAVKVDGTWNGDEYVPQDATLWELELIDIEAGTSRPITGWEDGHDPGSYSIFHQVEDRIFISHQIDPYGDMREAIYELDIETATVEFVGNVAGSVYGVQRVR